MSRSGYTDDCENLELYRANVDRALFGKRGQAFLVELVTALDALPEKRLIRGELIDAEGACCAIGAVCKSRALDVSRIDYEHPPSVAKAVGVANCMAAEIAFMNDEYESWDAKGAETEEQRWARMRKWTVDNLIVKKEAAPK